MIGLDTNVLIRYIVRDDEAQANLATKLIESQCSTSKVGFINLIVLCEIVWVLRRAYEYKKEVIIDVLKQILLTKEFMIENSENAWQALHDYSTGSADFADYVIGRLNKNAGCDFTLTFDNSAAKNRNFKIIKI